MAHRAVSISPDSFFRTLDTKLCLPGRDGHMGSIAAPFTMSHLGATTLEPTSSA